MNEQRYENQLKEILRTNAWSMDMLSVVRSVQLPDWVIGAGFVRNLVWDSLSAQKRTKLSDVDVLYFDPSDLSKVREKEIEQALLKLRPKIPWSVKNQARMHIRNKTAAYRDTEDALRYWLETPTAVAAKLEPDVQLTILAPYGLQDLFQMIIRPTPAATYKMDQFNARVADKDWLEKWPSLKIEKRAEPKPVLTETTPN